MEAIDFFALDYLEEDWPVVDESVRLFYRLKADQWRRDYAEIVKELLQDETTNPEGC